MNARASFAKGDLALFLPTRNSTVPVWAAFNVSFPHHFLSATGIISEQMKSREWIVARITNLTEKIADVKVRTVSRAESQMLKLDGTGPDVEPLPACAGHQVLPA